MGFSKTIEYRADPVFEHLTLEIGFVDDGDGVVDDGLREFQMLCYFKRQSGDHTSPSISNNLTCISYGFVFISVEYSRLDTDNIRVIAVKRPLYPDTFTALRTYLGTVRHQSSGMIAYHVFVKRQHTF